jgi:hypothetical protein
MRILLSLGLAIGVAAFVLWPMALLVTRSTRILPLDPAGNDIAFPFERLAAFVLPWRDGWPAMVLRPPSPPQTYANTAIFWETVCYVGLLPLAAMIFWLVRAIVRCDWPRRPWAFLLALGIAGMLLALPPMHEAFARLPGVLLRSPARLVYYTLFALSFGFGAAINWLGNLRGHRAVATAAIGAILLFQGIDLGRHDRCFIRTCRYWVDSPADRNLKQEVGDGRAAIDVKITIPLNRQLDDIGSFDSIFLAKPYMALLDLGHLPPRYNSQYIEGSDLTLRALQVCAVRVMLTTKDLPGQPPAPAGQSVVHRLRIPNPANRVDFFPLASTVTADLPTIHQHLRDPHYDFLHRLLIPAGSPAPPATAAGADSLPTGITYTRDDEDRMTLSANTQQPGYLRIDEAWDPGWHATVDGKPTPLFAGDDVFLTLPLSAGYHTVQVEFSTPGFFTGCIISIVCFGMLMWVTGCRRLPTAA